MTTTGIDARLDRIGTDDSYVIVPMDHGITMGAVQGLKDIESTIDGVTRGGADAVLMASITHFGNYTITEMKEHLQNRGLPMNL